MVKGTDELISQASSGNESAFNELYKLNTKHILFSCMQILGNMQDAEDVAQEIFFKTKKNIIHLKDTAAFKVWLNKVIVNSCIDFKRRTYKEMGNISLEIMDNSFVNEKVEFLPANYLEEKEKVEYLQEVLQNISDKYRTVVLLYYYDELSYAEIAAVLNTTVNSVDHLLRRAKLKIKLKMESKFRESVKEEKKQLNAALPILTIFLQNQADKIVTPQIENDFYEKLQFLSGDEKIVAQKFARKKIPKVNFPKRTMLFLSSTCVALVAAIVIISEIPQSLQGQTNGNITTPQNFSVAEPKKIITTISGNVYEITAVSEPTLIKEEEIFQIGLKIRLSDKNKKEIAKTDVGKDGSYLFNDISANKNEIYFLSIEYTSDTNYIVNSSSDGFLRVKLADDQQENLLDIYLKKENSASAVLSFRDEDGQITVVNPKEVALISSNTEKANMSWEIYDKADNTVVKSGNGIEMANGIFDLPANGGVKEYVLKVTIELDSGQKIVEEKNFFITI